MRPISFFTNVALCWLLVASAPAWGGEVIDGVIATVNRQPILQSDWDEAICFEAFIQQKPLSQLSEADRLNALRRLIDRQLLKSQMADPTYLQPSVAEVRDSLAKVRAQIPGVNDDAGWQNILSSYMLTEDMVKEHLRTELQVMSFVEVRLRPHIHVQADEIEAYYNNQLIPELRRSGAKIVALNEVEPRIRELLTQRHMDEMLDTWLHNLRQQSDIHSRVALPAVTSFVGQEGASGLN